MKHPRREEWVPYVFGEAEPEQRQQLEAHLQQCAECSAELGKWRGSLRRMDAWQLPPRQRRRRSALLPLGWAAAAVLMLAIGLAAGQWSAHAARSSLRSEMTRLGRQIADLKKQSLGVGQAKAITTEHASLETVKALQEAIASMNAGREEDRQALVALLQRLEDKQEAALISLRQDLETVASQADDQIQAARTRLIELSAVKNPSVAERPDTE